MRPDELLYLIATLGSRCFWCEQPLDFFRAKMRRNSPGDATIDHRRALSHGGTGLVANLVPACHACNRLRSMIDGGVPPHTVRSLAGQLGRLGVLERLLAAA